MTTTPRGVVAVLIAPDGHVIASAGDFAGVGDQDIHALRARQRLAGPALLAMCNSDMARALKSYTCERIMADLVESGFRIETIAIGYEGE